MAKLESIKPATPQGIVGIDLGDRSSQICRLDRESGTILEEQRVSTTTAQMQSYLGALPPQLVILESGTHSPWIVRLARQLGHEVIVANPSKVRAISSSRRKTDERDAWRSWVASIPSFFARSTLAARRLKEPWPWCGAGRVSSGLGRN